ncbi:lactose regulatory protein lac9 and GAL4-like protein [Vanrija albida]|uniref:Lactose regulatory protein lac9 and GAL4-like protein n=1 Tax=Vanrija albida TaxID=181172 RepID=A0ABR3PZB7_9TREE
MSLKPLSAIHTNGNGNGAPSSSSYGNGNGAQRKTRSPDSEERAGSAGKKQRAITACEACRQRKIACAGGHPCARCDQDSRECYYADRPNRSPLTRARMTELETRIDVYEQLWDSIFSGFSLPEAFERWGDIGLAGARSLALETLPRPASAGRSPHPTAQHRERDRPRESSSRYGTPHMPVSRVMSPVPAGEYDSEHPHAFVVEPNRDPGTYEWHEDPDTGGQLALDGMGSLANGEEGVSYMGLSSGATFVNVIRRLTPNHTLSVSPTSFTVSPGNVTGLDVAGVLNRRDTLSSSRRSVSAHRPMKPLPPLTEIIPLVDSYFRYFHGNTPLVHEPTIRAQIMGALPVSKSPGSEVLLYMIFAMGAFDGAMDESDPGYAYYEVARSALQRDMLEEGSLQLVQGLAIMANYLQRANRPNAGYLTLGLAIRMAVGLGLHTPLAGWHGSPLEKEMRSRVWWSIISLESGCSVTFGRPQGVGSVYLGAVPLPINCSDEHLTVSSETRPHNVSDITSYSAVIMQSTLARIATLVHDRILQSHTPTLEQIKRYDAKIVAAISTLPAEWHNPAGPYRLARSIQVWRIRDFRAILYRPILLAAAWDARNGNHLSISPGMREAIETCRSLALDNLHDMGEYTNTEGDFARGAEWYTLFFAFQSALTILLSVVMEPNHPSVGTWRIVIQTTAGWFRQLKSLRTVGNTYATILENIIGTVPSSVGDGVLPTPVSWPPMVEEGQNAAILDVERYWLEIMGNELALPNINASGGWDHLFQNNGFQF